MTVERLERTMSDVEYREWVELQAIDPVPDHLWNTAEICATVINMNKSKGKPVKPEDVIPLLKGPAVKQSEAAKERAIRGWLDGPDR